MELYPQSPEVVTISDDSSEDPTSSRSSRCVPRRRWTLLEDCNLVEMVVSRRHKSLWKTIAAGLPQRTSNSCRLRWIKLIKHEDAFTEHRWSEMAILMGADVMNQWRLMIAQNYPKFYEIISANHPLKRSHVQTVGPMINDPSVGDGDNGVGDTSMVLASSGPGSLGAPTMDLSLSLATGHNQNSINAAAAAQQRPSIYDFFTAALESE